MATSGEEQGGEGLDLVAEGKAIAVRRKALGWSRGDVAGRAALDPRIIQLLEMGLWSEGEAIDKVAAMLEQCGYTLDDVHARALAAKIDVIERLDRMVSQAEHRRRLVIGELDRRRDALARRLRDAAGLIDAQLGPGSAGVARLPAPAAGAP